MKKVIYIVAISFFLGSAYSYSASVLTNDNNITILKQKEKKTKVKEEDLPVTIQNVLKRSTYKDWKLDEAFFIEGVSEYYKIELKKDDQKQTLSLDKYGNKVSVLES